MNTTIWPQEPGEQSKILKITSKKIHETYIILYILLLVLSVLYCYLATFPKHGDFQTIYQVALSFIKNGQVISNETGATGYAYTLIQSIWIRLGAWIFHYNALDWNTLSPSSFQCWNMIPYLLALFGMVILSCKYLSNKYLCLLNFGTMTFTSIIVMGQTDILCAFLIFVSLIAGLKGITNKKSIKSLYLSMFILGLSTTIKTYGGILFPIYMLYYLFIVHSYDSNAIRVFKRASIIALSFIVPTVLPWIIYAKWFNAMAGGESTWLLDLNLASNPLHTISIWLLGYIILLRILIRDILNKPRELKGDARYFIFYIFATFSWFFVSVYTHPQWWIILIPSILLVLDNFRIKINYVYMLLLYILFIFYPMMWKNNIDYTLSYYIYVFSIDNLSSTILVTIIVSILILWTLDLRRELTKPIFKYKHPSMNGLEHNAIYILIIVFILTMGLLVTFAGTNEISVSQESSNQPVGEIFGNVTVGQTFFAPYPNLNAIEILLGTYMRVNTKDIIFHLRTSPESDQDIFSSKINSATFLDNSYYRFTIPEIKDSKDKSYYFFLESPDATVGNAITIYSSSTEAYKDGSQYKNGQPVEGDLTFRNIYMSRSWQNE